jgi:hypothetical protein
MGRPSKRPFRFFQREKIVLRQDQPMFFQLPIMIANGTGRTLSLAGALLRSPCELLNLLSEIGQQGTTSTMAPLNKLAHFDYAFAVRRTRFE